MSGGFVTWYLLLMYLYNYKKYPPEVCFRSKDICLVTYLNFATEAAFLFWGSFLGFLVSLNQDNLKWNLLFLQMVMQSAVGRHGASCKSCTFVWNDCAASTAQTTWAVRRECLILHDVSDFSFFFFFFFLLIILIS